MTNATFNKRLQPRGLILESVSRTAASTQKDLCWWFIRSVCHCSSCIQHVEARQQVQQSVGAQPGDGIHEWSVRGGGQSASCFVLLSGMLRGGGIVAMERVK